MKNIYVPIAIVSAITLLIMLPLEVLSAQERWQENPVLRSCESFRSSSDYVSQASAYCLKQPKSLVCDQKAAARFRACGFNGDFHQIHRKALTNMLMIFLISNSGKKIPEKFDKES